MIDGMSFDEIMERCLARVDDSLDKREGSIIYDALAPACIELETWYMYLEHILNQAFADTAERDFLILKAKERSLAPYPATSAVVKGVFTPADADVAGKRFNLGDLNFVVGDAITGEAGAYELTCETTGADGNKVLGALIPIEYVEGLETATATELLIPGEDEEETEDFRQRYFDSFGTTAFGGNVQEYINKVMALEGVGGVRVTPVWNGGGTVKCTIVDAEYNPATSTLISAVQEVIDPTQDGSGLGLAPIDHRVTIDTPATVTVNVYTEIEFGSGYSWDNMASAIEAAISAYLLELRTDWKNHLTGTNTIVRISQIETRLLDLEGIVDISGTEINETAANLVIEDNKIPVMGVVTHD